jgi:hypothetical protein
MPHRKTIHRLGNPHAAIPNIGELQKRTGASTNEPQFNMMRETAERHTRLFCFICPMWMALMNV